MLSRFVIIMLSSAWFSTAHGEDQIVTLDKGDIAPFSGTLFSTSAAARIAIELENNEATCGLKISEAVEKQKAYDKFKLDLKQSSLDACLEKYSVVTDLKQQQLDDLTEQLKKNTGPQPVWWFAGGVVGGITISLLTAYAYSQISAANAR
mgnify:FL=1|tara:strand:+ start:751 stop:1200 length:450 start_codon:yes stop_codon:yes gene_type:complete